MTAERVLVVDDEASIVQFARLHLGLEGFRVQSPRMAARIRNGRMGWLTTGLSDWKAYRDKAAFSMWNLSAFRQRNPVVVLTRRWDKR